MLALQKNLPDNTKEMLMASSCLSFCASICTSVLSVHCVRRFSQSTSTTTTPYSASIPSALRSCKSIYHVLQIHAHIIRQGLEQDHYLVTEIIGLSLSKSLGTLLYARSIFDRVHSPSIVLWNTLIKGYCEKSCFSESVSVFVIMRRRECLPDRYTYPSLIKVCSKEGKVREGRSIHGSTIRCGVQGDVFVGTALIDLYGKCKEIKCSRKVFDEMSVRNVVSWTAMVVGYLAVGDLKEAKLLFDVMPVRNVATWNAMIDGFVEVGDLKSARRIFDAMPEKNVTSFTTMIKGYANKGDMAAARFAFDETPAKDVKAWSALITGYAQNGCPYGALRVFSEMLSANTKPDKFVLVSLMSACSQIGYSKLAKRIDSFIRQSSIDIHEPHVIAALVDMHAKSGNLERAMELFGKMKERGLISYCSVIEGLSIHGHVREAIVLFNRMLNEGLIPDKVAFTIILTACSHAGLVEEGWYYFECMRHDYSIVPSPIHYACMVDLLCRSGQLQAAFDLIKSLPEEPHADAWGSLLFACEQHSDSALGEIVANKLIELEPQNAANYVLLSNIYAAANRWHDVSLVRSKLCENGARKVTGCSWIS